VTTGAGLRPIAKALDPPPDPTVRAPSFYPDIRTSGSDERRRETESWSGE
jgi:hypothetical protein